MPRIPGLKQFRQEGCVSHLIFDPTSRELAVIDPRTDLMQEYRAYISEHRLKPVIVIDTRLHWHHLSGTHLFAAEFQVPIAMSRWTSSARATQKLSHGEKIKVGELAIECLETPGVSSDAICLGVSPGLLFSGDSILIEAGAAVDLPGGSAESLWHSQRSILGALPGETVILPGRDRDDRLFSILKVERARNPDFGPGSKEVFLSRKLEERTRTDGDVRARLEYNAAVFPTDTQESHFGGSALVWGDSGETRRVAMISVEKFFQKVREQSQGTCFLDVRETEEFREGRVPGAINIPLSELSLHLEQLAVYRRIYVSCQTGRRSILATKTLDYIGFPDVVNVTGGFKAWVQAGLPVQAGSV